jgi:soluble lytic murein transglycosylase
MMGSKRLLTFAAACWLLTVSPVFGSLVLVQKMAGEEPGGAVHSAAVSTRDVSQLRDAFLNGVNALEEGNALVASLSLSGLETEYPVLGDYILYYGIRAANALEEPEKVLFLAERFFASYGESVLADRVQFERINALLAQEAFSAGGSEAREFLKKRLPGELRRRTVLLSGAAYEGEAQWDRAHEVYQRLAYEDPVTAEGREAESRMNHILHETEIAPAIPSERLFLSKVEALHRAFKFDDVITTCNDFEKNYSESALQEKALMIKAYALLKTGQIDGATAIYEKLGRTAIDRGIQAKATYRLGSYHWNKHNHGAAKKYFKRVIKKFPSSEWRLHAHYALGRIFEAEGEVRKAQAQYLQIGKANRGHKLAAQSAWRAAWVAYRAGNYKEARDAFEACMKRYEASDMYEAALYWKARSLEKLKHVEEAKEIYDRLASEFGWGFYGVMARKRLEANWQWVPDTDEEEGSDDTPWHPVPIQAVPGSASAFHLERAQELILIDRLVDAVREVDAVAGLRSWSLEEKLYIGTLYEKCRQYYSAVRLRARMDLVSGGDGPGYLRRTLYPLAYWDTVSEKTNGHGVDPFLVLSVMRQESLFQAAVVSPADARGLMQIIPPTGRMIASRLGVNDFSPEALFDPDTNIGFGVWYLQNLIERSDGDLVRVLSSYNAGEKRSDLWWNRTKHLDVDERIESISFRETRNYVKRVLRNLENYRRLYSHLVMDYGTKMTFSG